MERLLDWSYADLVAGQSDPNFLRSAERVRQLKAHGTRYVGLRGMNVYFQTFSSEYAQNRKIWTQEIMLLDLPETIGMRDMLMKDRVRLAMRGDVLVRCNCPAFLYWGFAYILSQIDGAAQGQYYGGWKIPGRPPTEPGLYPEDRNPETGGKDGNPPYYIGRRRRNWMQLNTLCKHLMLVGQVFLGHWNSVVSDLKKQGYE